MARNEDCMKPFALFVIASDLSIEAINKKLEQAYSNKGCVLPGEFHLVDGTEYPTFNPDGPSDNMSFQGTIPPIIRFSNAFSGKPIEDAAAWLHNGPESMFLQRGYFGVLDGHSERNDTITLCQLEPYKPGGIPNGGNEYGELRFFPESATEAGVLIGVFGAYYSFDGALDDYQMRIKNMYKAGPDLSRGKPFSSDEESTACDDEDAKIAEEEDLQLELRQRLSRI